MQNLPAPTLEQLLVFAKVADCGSFSAAARELNRTQSVISYTVSRLEAQLGLTLFERAGHRPRLTEAGYALLGDSRRIGLAIDDLRARANGLVQGLESEISVAIDAIVPDAVTAAVAREFALAFPTVNLLLRVETLETIIRLVMERVCTIAICGPIFQLPDGMDRRHCGVAQMVTVAAADHPLAQLGDRLSTAVLREHTQLILMSSESRVGLRGFAPHAVRTWPISSLPLLQALLHKGLGWAIMPELLVRGDVAVGRLARLHLSGAPEWPYPLDLVRRGDTPVTPATQWLADALWRAISGMG